MMKKESFSPNGIAVKITDLGMVQVEDLFCNKIFVLYPEEAEELCRQIRATMGLHRAFEIQKRHKELLEKTGITPQLQEVIDKLSDPVEYRKHFNQTDDCRNPTDQE